MHPGPGKREVIEEVFTIAETMKNTQRQEMMSHRFLSASSPDAYLKLPVVEKKPAIVLADSMGECIRAEDEYFTAVVKTRYNFDWMAQDVVDGVVNVQRYKNIILWAGAHNIHQMDLNQVEADLRGLINVIVPRNRKAFINVSTLIPKPRENHLTVDKFHQFNDSIKKVVWEF